MSVLYYGRARRGRKRRYTLRDAKSAAFHAIDEVYEIQEEEVADDEDSIKL
jgi:hypothetical protein